MIKNICLAAIMLASLGGFNSAQGQKNKQGNITAAKTDVKFLEDISTEPASVPATTSDPKDAFNDFQFISKKTAQPAQPALIENASGLQFKFALLLDTEVEQVKNLTLFQLLDEWMGIRYRLGGTTKSGIDCSALMQIICSSVYNITLPRTCREQYQFSGRISRTELREGDLVFFNTVGGVSHVGLYLQNNKFIHASSGGVMISDLYDEYWMRRFVGAGRVETSPSSNTADTANL